VAGVFCGVVANFSLKETFQPLEVEKACNLCDVKEPHFHEIFEKVKFLFHYTFIDLPEGISKRLLIGILIGGFISYLIPQEIIRNYFGSGWKAMALMLIIGIPIYACATGSIPIVAALMFKGMSAGAGLVFLLAGPATNVVTITVVAKDLGKKAVALYLASISLTAILLGMFLNSVWKRFAIQGNYLLETHSRFLPGWVETGSSLILISLVIFCSANEKP